MRINDPLDKTAAQIGSELADRERPTFYLSALRSRALAAVRLARRVQDVTGFGLSHDWMARLPRIRVGAQRLSRLGPEEAWSSLIDGVHRASFVVLLDFPRRLDSERASRDMSVELGYAIATGTPVFALSKSPDKWLLVAQRQSSPAEYGLPTIAKTEEQLLKLLRDWIAVRGIGP